MLADAGHPTLCMAVAALLLALCIAGHALVLQTYTQWRTKYLHDRQVRVEEIPLFSCKKMIPHLLACSCSGLAACTVVVVGNMLEDLLGSWHACQLRS